MAEPAANENDQLAPTGEMSFPETRSDARCHFRLFQAELVSLTSTQSDGGDWRWQFCSPSGEILTECSGYHSEASCRAAILRLQNEAAYATTSRLG